MRCGLSTGESPAHFLVSVSSFGQKVFRFDRSVRHPGMVGRFDIANSKCTRVLQAKLANSRIVTTNQQRKELTTHPEMHYINIKVVIEILS